MDWLKRLFKPSPPKKPRRLGLALGGGGARGLAHIGVIKVLEQAGLRVDMAAGASIGGVVAAAYAAGKTPAEMEALAYQYADRRTLLGLLDPAPFNPSFLQGKRIRDVLSGFIGHGLTFADTRFPIALTATDLPRGAPVVVRDGPLIDAVMATSALPGLWPPVCIHGCQLADGGLTDNIPVNVLRRMGADVVVAVRVAPCFPRQDATILDVPLLPDFGDRFYHSILILSDALTSYQLEKYPPDVLITPQIPDCVWLLGFDQPEAAIRAGEEAAREALPAIRAALGN
ncbi:MAG: patatin-like phospholipase family protein [Chloroflexota bacterium]